MSSILLKVYLQCDSIQKWHKCTCSNQRLLIYSELNGTPILLSLSSHWCHPHHNLWQWRNTRMDVDRSAETRHGRWRWWIEISYMASIYGITRYEPWELIQMQTMEGQGHLVQHSQLKQQGGFQDVGHITPDFSKFEYLICLTYVFEIWQIWGTTTPPPRSCDLAKQFARWFMESEPSTSHTIRTLQHVGSSIAYATMALPRIWWPEPGNFRVMLYLGHTIMLDDFGKAFSQMEQDMVKIWEQDILLGFKIRINYNNLINNISNTDMDYSLFSDPWNPCFQNASTFLYSAIIKDPIQYAIFVKGYTHDGWPIWNNMALCKWLINYAKFEELLLTKAELTAGSSSCGTEINCLVFKNTCVWPSCGLFMMGKHLAYLCHYHKGSSITSGKCTLSLECLRMA